MFLYQNSSGFKRADPNSSNGAEPMNLGSPLSSPKGNPSSNQNYLPPYLFGESSNSPVGASWNTPIKQHSSINSPSLTPVSHLREKRNIFHSPVSSPVIANQNTGKNAGPPIESLLYSSSPKSYEVMKFENMSQTFAGTENANYSGVLTPSKSFSINNSLISPAQMDPFFTQGEALKTSEQLDESWVTVFGFPSASVSYILQQFSQYGTIIQHKMAPNGNWMHIQYQSKLQVKKALSKNGKVFGGNIMIGVKPCIEMDLMDSGKENAYIESSSVIQNSSTSFVQDSLPSDFSDTTPKPNLKNIRPLTSAYQSPINNEEITQKSGNIVTKALEYIWKL